VNSRLSLFWRAIRHWEFWPYWLFYTPVYLQLLLNGLKSGRLGRFTCANPAIPYGGLLEYSKWSLLAQLPERYCPRTLLLPLDSTGAAAEAERVRAGISYPLYAKPDRGERGLMVAKVSNARELAEYFAACASFAERLRASGRDPSEELILVQAMAHGACEFGVLYARMPGSDGGQITSIVEKELISVTGDGSRTLAQLIDSGERTRLHRIQLHEEYADRLADVPASGTEVVLVEVGNHVRGATFLDANRHATPELARLFDTLVAGMDGFCIGRFDVRCESAQALAAGEFQAVEVNGVNSEPAHIYDPSNRLVAAYRDLLAHWRLVESIAAANAANGCPVTSGRELIAAIRRHARRRSLAK
jgi:hypothetical protein